MGIETSISYGNYKLDQEKFEKLVALADQQEQITLKVLYNAVVNSINILNADSSAVNVKDWEVTKNSYEEYSGTLWKKYMDKAEALPALRSIQAVVEYAKTLGYKLKRATAYKHQKENRFRPDKDGLYPIAVIDKYLATLRKLDGTTGAKLDRAQAGRAQWEEKKTQAQAEHWALRTKILAGEYVEKGEFERALAQRAAVFKNDLESFIRGQAAGIINLVGGTPDKTPDLIEFMLDRIAEWLNRYADEREFTVPALSPAALLAEDEARRMPGEQKLELEQENDDEE